MSTQPTQQSHAATVSSSSSIPNVQPKFSPSEQEKLETQLKILQQQNAVQLVTDLKQVQQTILPRLSLAACAKVTSKCESKSATAEDEAAAATAAAETAKLAELVPEAVRSDGQLVPLPVSALYIKNCHDCSASRSCIAPPKF
jgi:hypothetical protein